MSLAEKFQITVPYSEKKDDDGTQWKDVNSVRCVDDNPQSTNTSKFNILPSTEIFDQYFENGGNDSRLNNFAQGFGGNTDVSSLGSESINNPKTFTEGFVRRTMKATDDQYDGEHIDLFYGEAVDEKGNVGFVERNNYLDRS
jgi:hypothetical protein